MAEFSFTGRKGGTGSLDTSTGLGAGGQQWARNPGGIYSKTGASGENVWIDPRTKTARDDPMEGQLTGRGGGQFFTNEQGFRLTETGDIFKHPEFGAQRVLQASEGSPYRQVLFGGGKDLYMDATGVMREGKMPTAPGAPAGPGGVAPTTPSSDPFTSGTGGLGGAPGYPVIGAGAQPGAQPGGPGAQGLVGAGQPGQPGVATPQVQGGIQPFLPRPTASAILSDPIQSRLDELAGPTPASQQYAAQSGMTPEQDINFQLDRIISADNPVIRNAMEQARTNAINEANSRGLLNTTMAIEAGEKAAQEAMYNVAVPMAQEAAKANQASTLANLQSRQQFQQTGAQIRSQETQQRSQLASGEILQNLANNNAISLAEIDRITKLQGINMEQDAKVYLQQLTEDNKLALQTNASVATAYSNTVGAIGNVYSNTEMDWHQQDQAARWYMDQFEGYVAFQDTVNQTNYAEAMNWGQQSGTRQDIGLIRKDIEAIKSRDGSGYAPFGSPGTQPGEQRYSGVTNYTWDGAKWTQTRPANF